jgi:lambda family phage portal protein
VNIIDKLISYIDPSAAYKRMAWRDAIRNYDAGGMERVNNNWISSNQTGEQTDKAYRDIVRARARDLERNADVYEAVIRAWVRNVVGDGYMLQAQTGDSALNDEIETLFKLWQKPKNCDITGMQSLTEMARMAERRLRVDGGVLFVKTTVPDGPIPFALQMLEVDKLDTSLLEPMPKNGNSVVGGIEIDSAGKPIAYYIKTSDGTYDIGKTVRIDAQRVIYLSHRTRPSQVREMPPSANILERTRDINEYVEAVSIKERVAACLAVFIKKITPAGGFGRDMGKAGGSIDEQSGYSGRTLTPGMIQYLQPGEDIQSVMPPNSGANAADMVRLQQRMIGAGQGLSYEVVSRDMSQVNYSSARQGLLEDQREYRVEQQYLIDHFYDEIYEEFIASAVLAGVLSIDSQQFWRNKTRYLAHKFIPSGWSWIDPLKEANANKVALETGQTTLARICAAYGADWQDELKQRAEEIQYAKSLGLNIYGEPQATAEGGDIGSKSEDNA